MPKTRPSKSTLRYVAKQGYQLHLMRGIQSGKIAGLYYSVNAREGFVRVFHYDIVETPLSQYDDIRIAKSWAELI